jgi:hypothetical protein
MLRRPSIFPRFATNAAPGALVEPAEPVRVGGFPAGSRPPAQWDNWLWHVMGECIDFLRGASLSNFTRTTFPAGLGQLAVDLTTAETTSPVHRIVACGHNVLSGTPTLYASVRGNAWETLTPGNSGFGYTNAVAFSLARWFCGTGTDFTGGYAGTGLLWCTFPDGSPYTSPPSAISNPTGNWTAVSLPAGTTDIRLLAASPDGSAICGITNTQILVVEAFAGSPPHISAVINATLSAAPTGKFTGIVYTGAAWVAVTDAGELYRTTDPTTTWTKLSATLVSGSPNTVWQLAVDLLGNVVAYYLFSNTAPANGLYVSPDHGVTWPTGTAPPFNGLSQLSWVDGTWVLTCSSSPYLATSNDLSAGSWLRLPVPILEIPNNNDLYSFVYSEGALVIAGNGAWLLSGRASDMSPGPWTPGVAPTQLHDAAYLRGFLVDPTAPSSGQILLWDSPSSSWKPHTLAGGTFDPTLAYTWASLQTFTAGIAGASGGTLPFYIGTTLVGLFETNGMLVVGTAPSTLFPHAISTSEGYILVDTSGGNAAVPALILQGGQVTLNASSTYPTLIQSPSAEDITIAAGHRVVFAQAGRVETTTAASGTYTTDAIHSHVELTGATVVTLDDASWATDQVIEFVDRTGDPRGHSFAPNGGKTINGIKGILGTEGTTRIRKGSDGEFYSDGVEAEQWPPEMPALKDWWDAEQNVIGTTWSGVERGTPLIGSNFPSSSTSADFNGHGILTFNGTNTTLASAIAFAVAQGLTVTIAAKVRATGTNGVIWDGSGNLQGYANSTGGTGMSMYGGAFYNSTSIPSGNAEIWSFVANGGNAKVYKNGVQVGVTGSCGTAYGTVLTVGSSNGGSANFVSMDLAFISFQACERSAAEVLRLHRRLGHRYGITVA